MIVRLTRPPRYYPFRWKVNTIKNARGFTITMPWLIVKVVVGKVRPIWGYPAESETASKLPSEQAGGER